MRKVISKSTATFGACFLGEMFGLGMPPPAEAGDVFSFASTRRVRGQRQEEEKNMKKMILGLGIIAIAFILASPGLATTMTVNVSEDATIAGSSVDTTINGYYLYTGQAPPAGGGNFVSLVKFDLTDLKELVDAGGAVTINSIRFNAYIEQYTATSPNTTVVLKLGGDDKWSASTVTYNNYYRENIDGSYISSLTFSATPLYTIRTWTISSLDLMREDILDDGLVTLAIDAINVNTLNLAAMELKRDNKYWGSYLELDYTITGSESTSPVPEPATILLLGSGLTAAAFGRRFRR